MRRLPIGRPWDYPCFHSSCWLVLSAAIPSLRRIMHFLFILVFVVSSSRTIHTETKLSHPQSGSGACWRGSCREQGPIEEELFRIQQYSWVAISKISLTSKIIQKLNRPNHWLVHDVKHSTTLWRVNFVVQVWGVHRWLARSYTAWNWKTRASIEKQTYRRYSNVQRTSWPRISEIRRCQVFQGYFETRLHQRSFECLSSGDVFQFIRARRENSEMVKWIGKFSLLLTRLKDAWMDMLPTFSMSETRRHNRYLADVAKENEERRSRSQELLNLEALETRGEWNTGGRPRSVISIQW